MTETWEKLPLELMDELAEKETYRRDVYRPIYSIHKWWARRPGSTFRCLGLASLTDDTITKGDILTERDSGTHDGLYIGSYNEQINPNDQHIDRDVTVLDPFAGGGTTLVELNRLGADVIGYELNPVAWWTEKKSMDDVNLDILESEFERILEETRDELGDYYTTIDPDTGNECEVLYYFQSQHIPCLTCDEEVQLFPRYELAPTKKTSPGVLYCPNQDCDDRIIELHNRDKGLGEGDEVNISEGQVVILSGDEDNEPDVIVSEDGNEICPSCGEEFDPNNGTYGYGKYTCSNGHKHDVKETLKRRDEKPSFDYFALQYLDPSSNKNFKEFDKEDFKRNQEAIEKLRELQGEIRFPEQNIPDGDKTGALLNYNYERFDELFTDRHLLTFGLLLEKMWDVRKKEFEEADSHNIAEFLVTSVANNLNRIGKLCKWDIHTNKSSDVFKRHAYISRVQPTEANPLNHDENAASLNNAFQKVFRGKEYCERPFEKIKNRKQGKMEQFFVDTESISSDRVSGLYCKTAEQIDEDDETVDFVITDPPYYDNVQYSELSDYFYVWLRECLKDEYEEFQPELVPKAREIVANKSAGKDNEFFVESLSNVFSECHRVLKEDGEMVFTYHHNENDAWSVILEALIRSGFTVTGAYPVQSEMPNNPHISDLDNAEYDILLFATKESTDEEISLQGLQQNLHFELQDLIADERERHENLSQADLGVILRGKCMYYYSKHYPEVYSDGEQVPVSEALEAVDEIIQQALDRSVNLPQTIDSLSQAYAALHERHSQSSGESYDDLNKHLLARNLNVSDLEDEKLVKGPRDKKEPAIASERVHHIERKLNGNGATQATLTGSDEDSELLDIDKVHYLYHLYTTDQNTSEYLKNWKDPDIVELAEFMAEVTGDERYEDVMQMSLAQF